MTTKCIKCGAKEVRCKGLCSKCYSVRPEKIEYNKKYAKENPDKVNKWHRTWAAKNKEHVSKYMKEYREDNLEKVKTWNNKTRVRNKEKIIEYRNSPKNKAYMKKYRDENREKIIQQQKENYHNSKDDPEWKAKRKKQCHESYMRRKEKIQQKRVIWLANNKDKTKLQHERRRALKNNVIHEFSEEEWRNKVLNTNGICPNCGKHIGEDKMTLDHIIPISLAEKGKIYTIDDVQPLCFSCNASKGNR